MSIKEFLKGFCEKFGYVIGSSSGELFVRRALAPWFRGDLADTLDGIFRCTERLNFFHAI